MVLPRFHDMLVQQKSRQVTARTSNSTSRPTSTPIHTELSSRLGSEYTNNCGSSEETPQPMIRCITPWNRDCANNNSDENRNDDDDASHDSPLFIGSFHAAPAQFPDCDRRSHSYSYSVGPFAHPKSEGTSSLSLANWDINDFTPASPSLLGSGKFGSVQLFHTRYFGRVALKGFNKSTRQDKTIWKREIEIQTRLSHKCILPCFGYFQTESSLYVVLDYCSGGDLANFIHKFDTTIQDCKVIISQLASALAHLQHHNIAHRDVKSENVLVSSKKPLQTKLADFGYAIHCPDSDFRSTLCGTLACLPPEMLSLPPLQYHALMIDSWSLGILAHELVLDEPVFPWPGHSNEMKELIRTYCDEKLCIPHGSSADFSDFVSSLLMRNPSSRLTPYQALGHVWLSFTSPDKSTISPDCKRTKQQHIEI